MEYALDLPNDGGLTDVSMDDAANGRRGLRAVASPDLLQAIRDAYGIECPTNPVDLGGSSCLNLLIGSADEPRVLRVYRPYVTTSRLNAIQLVRRELGAAGVPCPNLVLTLDERPYIVFHDRLLEVERYTEYDAAMNTWERLEIGLTLLGRIHTILRDLDLSADGKAPEFANHVEASAALDGALRGTHRIRSWQPSPDELQLTAAAEDLAHWVSSAEACFNMALPRQIVHGDYWDNNVLFHDGRVALVTDFDFMGERARIDDLALTLFYTCLEYYEESASDEQLRRLRRLLDAYDAGLDTPLTVTERLALPLAMARQPLWSFAVWIALLDDQRAARRHAAALMPEVKWALGVVREARRWQAAFT